MSNEFVIVKAYCILLIALGGVVHFQSNIIFPKFLSQESIVKIVEARANCFINYLSW